MRRQGATRVQVGAYQQRINHSGSRTGVGQSLVTPWRHSGEGRRRSPQQTREARDLLDIGNSVPAHTRWICFIGRVYLIAANELAIRAGLAGSLTITVKDGKHFYDFVYTLTP